MARKVILGIAGLVAILLVIVVFNTWRVGPPVMADIPPASETIIDAEAAAGRLAESVRFQTISHETGGPPPAEALLGLRAYMVRNYPRLHRALKQEVVNNYSLLYTWEGRDKTAKPILLAAHMDVVPIEPGTESDWTHPPYAGVIADGHIWGRGVMDMKCSLMGILEAVEHLLDEDFSPQRTVYLAFGHDEEIGGSEGTAKIAELLTERGVRLDFTLDEGLVITDGIIPGVARPAALIGLAEKGLVNLKLTANGQGGHSARPPRHTSVGKLGKALHRLETNPMPARLQSMYSPTIPIRTVIP